MSHLDGLANEFSQASLDSYLDQLYTRPAVAVPTAAGGGQRRMARTVASRNRALELSTVSSHSTATATAAAAPLSRHATAKQRAASKRARSPLPLTLVPDTTAAASASSSSAAAPAASIPPPATTPKSLGTATNKRRRTLSFPRAAAAGGGATTSTASAPFKVPAAATPVRPIAPPSPAFVSPPPMTTAYGRTSTPVRASGGAGGGGAGSDVRLFGSSSHVRLSDVKSGSSYPALLVVVRHSDPASSCVTTKAASTAIELSRVVVTDESKRYFTITCWNDKAKWTESLHSGDVIQFTDISIREYRNARVGSTRARSVMNIAHRNDSNSRLTPYPLPESFPPESIDRRVAELVHWSRSSRSGLCLEYDAPQIETDIIAAAAGGAMRCAYQTLASLGSSASGGKPETAIHFIGQLHSLPASVSGSDHPFVSFVDYSLSESRGGAAASTVRLALASDSLRYEFEDSEIGDYYDCNFVSPVRTRGAWMLAVTPHTRVRKIESFHPGAIAIAKRMEAAAASSGGGGGTLTQRSGLSVTTALSIAELLRSRAHTPIAIRARVADLVFPCLNGEAVSIANCHLLTYTGCMTCRDELTPNRNGVYQCMRCPIPVSRDSAIGYYYRDAILHVTQPAAAATPATAAAATAAATAAAPSILTNIAVRNDVLRQLLVVPPAALLASASFDADSDATNGAGAHNLPFSGDEKSGPTPSSSAPPAAAAAAHPSSEAAARLQTAHEFASDFVEIVRALRAGGDTFEFRILSRTVNDENGILIRRHLTLHHFELAFK